MILCRKAVKTYALLVKSIAWITTTNSSIFPIKRTIFLNCGTCNFLWNTVEQPLHQASPWYATCNPHCNCWLVKCLIVSIMKGLIVIGSLHTYTSRNRHMIMYMSNYMYPIWTFCNWTTIIGYPGDLSITCALMASFKMFPSYEHITNYGSYAHNLSSYHSTHTDHCFCEFGGS